MAKMKKVSKVFKPSQVDKNIYQVHPHSFQVRMMFNGIKINKVHDTLEEAQNWRDMHRVSASLDLHESKIYESRIQKRQSRSYTVAQALTRYKDEVTALKKGASEEGYRINKALRQNLAKKGFFQVQASDVIEFMDDIGGSDNNRRKYCCLISHLYNIAKKRWKLKVTNPVHNEIELPSNGIPRTRRLEEGELEKILSTLNPTIISLFEFAIETTMRRGEVLKIEWQNFKESESVITVPDPKNKEERGVALSPFALEIVLAQPRGELDGKIFPVTYSKIRYQWDKCKKAASLKNLRWHDIRREAISRLIESGKISESEIRGMSGHKTLQAFLIYATPRAVNTAKKLAVGTN